ncbi:MAG: hypothetical protein QXU20_03880 [Candidatus Woesearchaeota archaeon]
MKYFQKINKPEAGKTWKEKKSEKCSQCGKEINIKENHIILTTFWKIKNKSDSRYFCSFNCLEKWLKSIK